MKIRTDFVTNSSSSAYTEVIIDNPVLLEILQRYKDMGLLGENDSIFGIGEYRSMDEQFDDYQYKEQTKTPALFYFENRENGNTSEFFDLYECPYSLDKVLENIISILGAAQEFLDDQLLPLLKEELLQRKDEISAAFLNVHYLLTYSGDGGDYYQRFEYDPINGESITNKDPDKSYYCEKELIIDNPVLLEILQRYKDMGLLGDNDSIIGIGEYRSMDKHFDEDQYKDKIKTPAFFYFEEQDDDDLKSINFIEMDQSIYSLEEVLPRIVQILETTSGFLDRQILPKLQEELDQRKNEINNAYKSVSWDYVAGDSYEFHSYDPINGWR